MGKEFLSTNKTTFTIAPVGKITKIWEKAEVKDRAKEVFNSLSDIINSNKKMNL